MTSAFGWLAAGVINPPYHGEAGESVFGMACASKQTQVIYPGLLIVCQQLPSLGDVGEFPFKWVSECDPNSEILIK